MIIDDQKLSPTYAPLVSIIAPCYQCADTIDEMITSVRTQTFSDWELILVNDGSTDQTWERLTSWAKADNRIQALSRQENRGVAATRNEGIDRAKGELISFIDSDDRWYPEKLAKQVPWHQTGDAQFSFCPYERVDASGHYQSTVTYPKKVSYHDMLSGLTLCTSSIMLNHHLMVDQAFESVGHEDFRLWAKILRDHKLCAYRASDTAQVIYRVSADSLSGNKYRAAQWQWRNYQYLNQGNTLKSLYYFGRYATRAVLRRIKR